jgi:hypothetical protein
LVVKQLQAGKNMSTEAGDIVRIRHQVTTGEDITDRDLACAEIIFKLLNH